MPSPPGPLFPAVCVDTIVLKGPVLSSLCKLSRFLLWTSAMQFTYVYMIFSHLIDRSCCAGASPVLGVGGGTPYLLVVLTGQRDLTRATSTRICFRVFPQMLLEGGDQAFQLHVPTVQHSSQHTVDPQGACRMEGR